MLNSIDKTIKKIKDTKPLVLNMTNDVTMDFIANGLLSIGASPVMSQAIQECEDLVKLANVIVINLGTLNEAFVHLCKETCRIANQLNKPIILDPVGAGASRYRTESALALLDQYQVNIIRGNASEIISLVNSLQQTKGVDSIVESYDAVESAKMLSKRYHTAVVVSGKTDFIIDQDMTHQFSRGSSLMPKVTGTGCLLSSVVAAFSAVEDNRLTAASTAVLFYSICGEIAEKNTSAPGSFKMHFIDALSLNPAEILSYI